MKQKKSSLKKSTFQKNLFLLSLVTLCLLLCSTATLAQTSTTYTSGWHTFSQTISSKGEVFNVYGQTDILSSYEDQPKGTLLVIRDDKSTHIRFGECRFDSSFEYCFSNISFTHNKITQGEGITINPALEYTIKGTDYSSYVNIDFLTSQNELKIGEQITFAISLSHNFPSSLFQVHLSILFPDEIELLHSSSLDLFTKKSNNHYTLSLNSILSNDKKTYSFTIKGKENSLQAPIIFSMQTSLDKFPRVIFSQEELFSIGEVQPITFPEENNDLTNSTNEHSDIIIDEKINQTDLTNGEIKDEQKDDKQEQNDGETKQETINEEESTSPKEPNFFQKIVLLLMSLF